MVEMREDTPTPEGLPHRPGEIVVGLTEIPGGKRWVGMTHDDQEWVLMDSQPGPIAHQMRKQLKKDFDVDVHIGAGVNITKSLEANKIVVPDNPEEVPTNGVYVTREDFIFLQAENRREIEESLPW